MISLFVLYRLGIRRGFQSKYGKDATTHLDLDKDAYLYAAGDAYKGFCYGLSSTNMSVLRLLGYHSSQCGSFQGSWSSQSADRDLAARDAVARIIDLDLIR